MLLDVLLAVSALVVVAGALGRAVLVRRRRRDLDRYLRWLLEDATGPISLARPARRS